MTENDLKRKIEELQRALQDRDHDLTAYKNELSQINAQLEQMIDRVQNELKLSHAIFELLIPKEIPNIPGFEFSSKYVASAISGGDYFEIFHLEDKFRFGILMASSSGFGMSALFLSVLLKLTGQMEARKGAAPNALIQLMANELVSKLGPHDLANVFYGIVDRRSFELSFCRVGHLASFHFQSANKKLIPIETGYDSIKQNFDTALKTQTISLSPRDKLILCSPGILEVSNRKEERFGAARLSQILIESSAMGVHDLRNEILFQVEKFAQGREYQNDLTIIVIEVKDRVIKLAKN